MSTVNTSAVVAPIGVDGFWQPRRAAFWVLVFFLANGVYSVMGIAQNSQHLLPQAFWTALAAWSLYALPFYLLLRAMDLNAQSRSVVWVLAFAWGGLGAVYLAIPANDAIISLSAKLGSPAFRDSWGAAIAGPTTEELLKYLGVVLLVLVARTQFLSPLTLVLTGALVGLGFQIVEDFVYSINAAIAAPTDNQMDPVLSMVLVRGFLCGLWSHSVFTAITAYGLAQFLFRRELGLGQRVGRAALFYVLGWLLHAVWNSPFLHEVSEMGALGPLAFILLKGLPVLAVGIGVWRMALREQSVYLGALAEAMVADPQLIAPDERDSLCSLGGRRAARKTLQRIHGRAAARALHHLQRQQLQLLMSLGHWGPSPRTERCAQAVQASRAALQRATR